MKHARRIVIGLALAFAASQCWAQVGIPGPVGPPIGPGGPGGGIKLPKGVPTPSPTPTPKPAEEAFTGTYKFVSLTDTTLVGTPLAGSTGGTFSKLAAGVAASLSAAKSGDIVILQGVKARDGVTIQSTTVYTPKLGEDDAFAYVFVGKGQQTVGKETFTVVNVTKFTQPFAFAVPNVNTSGKPAPLPAMLKAIDALAAGSLVEINADAGGKPPLLRSIRPYGDVRLVKFSKVFQVSSGAGSRPSDPGQTGHHSAAGIQVLDGETPLTFVIDPDSRSAASLSDKVLQFKEGQNVIVRSTKTDHGVWLVDVRLGPATTK